MTSDHKYASEVQPAEKLTQWAAWLSLAVSSAVLGIKFAAYGITGSSAIFSDALESIVNVIAALVALLVMKAVAAPADEDHPYGHGKLEYFSSAFEGGLVAFAALAIGYHAGQGFLEGRVPEAVGAGALLMIVSGAINFALGAYLVSVGRSQRSAALQASGRHVLSDVWSTVAVLGGLLAFALTGWTWVDPAVALLVAVLLLIQGARIVRESIGGLIDEIEPSSLTEMARAFTDSRKPGIIDIHQVKVIRSGRFHHIDAHVVMPEFWDVSTAHRVTEEFEAEVVKRYSYDGEMAIHLDPCGRNYCKVCSLPDCPVRAAEFVAEKEFIASHIILSPADILENTKAKVGDTSAERKA